MKTLKRTLEKFYVPDGVLGEFDVDLLVKGLQKDKNSLNQRYWITTGIIIIVFIIYIFITFFFLNNSKQMTAVFSALGVSITWPVYEMNKTSKELARFNLTITLCQSGILKANEIKKMIKNLINKL